MIFFSLQETILNISFVAILFGNAIELNPYLAIPLSICVCCIIAIYSLARNVLVQSKQLELKSKSPIFTRLNQTVQGLIQIHLFGDSAKYAKKVDREITISVRNFYQAYFMAKGMFTAVYLINYIGLCVGLFIGIKLIQDDARYFLYCFCLLSTLFSVSWSALSSRFPGLS